MSENDKPLTLPVHHRTCTSTFCAVVICVSHSPRLFVVVSRASLLAFEVRFCVCKTDGGDMCNISLLSLYSPLFFLFIVLTQSVGW